jgi:ferredoxin-NADP reductase
MTVSEPEWELLVRTMRWESDCVISVVLEDPDGGELPAWAPGAHIDLLLPAATRQYSLCGDPADRRRYRVAVLNEPASRGGSRYVHESLRPGDLVRVRGPRNRFALKPAQRYLFIAGGIGVTPLLPMVAQAQADGADWRLVYGGRSRRTLAFLDELGHHGDRVHVVPEDEAGLLNLAELLGDLRPGTVVYCCGPERLLDAVEERCVGWPAGTLHLERFRAREVVVEGEDRPFELVCAASGVTVTVGADESAVDALDAVQVSIPSACREGICGTCEVKVLDGVPDHRDSLLTDEERAAGRTIMLCVSRASGERLVVDA